MRDKLGRKYAKLSDLKPGDFVQVDSGFTCLPPNSKHEVKAATDGDLYIVCANNGVHSLQGQLAHDEVDSDNLVGIYKISQ